MDEDEQLRKLSKAYYQAMSDTAMSGTSDIAPQGTQYQQGGGDYEESKKTALADLLAAVATDYKDIHSEWFTEIAKLKKPPPPSWFSANTSKHDMSAPFPETLFDSTYYEDVFFFKKPEKASLKLSEIAKTTNTRTLQKVGGPIKIEKALAKYIQTVCRYYFTTTPDSFPVQPNHFVLNTPGANLENNFAGTLKTILTAESANPEGELTSALGCLNTLFTKFYEVDGVKIGITPNPQTPFMNLLMARAIMGLLVFYPKFPIYFLMSLKYKLTDQIPKWYSEYLYFVKATFPEIITNETMNSDYGYRDDSESDNEELEDMLTGLQNAENEEEAWSIIEKIVENDNNTEGRDVQRGGAGDFDIEDEESAKKSALAKLMAAVIKSSKNNHHDAWFENARLKKLEPQGLKDMLTSWVSTRLRTNADGIQTLSPWFPEILFDKTEIGEETTTFHEGIFFFQAPEFASDMLRRRESSGRVGGPVETERALAEYIRTASKYYFSKFISDQPVDNDYDKQQVYADLVAGNDLSCAVKCLNDFFSEYATNEPKIGIDIPPNIVAPYSDILLSRAIIGLLHFSEPFAEAKAEILNPGNGDKNDILETYNALFADILDNRLIFVFGDGSKQTPEELRKQVNQVSSGGAAAATTGPASFAMAIVTSLAVVLTSTLVGAMT
jgi:hypothetical protein